MAKTRPGASKKGGSRKKANARSDSASSSSLASAARPKKSPRAYVEEAEASMTQGDVQVALAAALKAQKLLEDARSGSANTNIVVDGVGLAAVYALVGEIHLENGDEESARSALERSVQLDANGTLPDAIGGGVDKYLYLAQLSEQGGRDSLKWYELGSEALRERVSQLHNNTSSKPSRPRRAQGGDGGGEADAEAIDNLNSKLSQILCAMTEVWMTDLSYESDCEAQCEKLTTEATLVGPRSPEVWQTLANVRISQSRDDEARTALQRSLDLWEALPPDHPDVPAFSVRVSLARMLMTVGWLPKAIDVTTNLLREDEQSVEVWYLAGFANYLLGQQLKEEGGEQQKKWKTLWTEARRCLGRCLRRFVQQEYEDDRLGEHAKELMQELEATVGEAPQKEKDEEDYEEEDEDEWEDDNEEDDDNDDDEDEDEEMKD